MIVQGMPQKMSCCSCTFYIAYLKHQVIELTHPKTTHNIIFLAHLSRRLRGELTVYQSSRRPWVRGCVRASTFSNMNISETSRRIAIKFYLKQHWGGGKASAGFDPDRIRTLVSMATDSSHRVIMGKTASSRFLKCF